MNQWKIKEAMQDEMANNVRNILKVLNKKKASSQSIESQQSIEEEPDGLPEDSWEKKQ